MIKKKDAPPGKTSVSSNGPKLFTIVEQMPQFPGGDMELMKFLRDHIKYPEKARADKVVGMVVVNFVVNSFGKIEKIKVERGVNAELDAEAVRVISDMPDWSPGKQHGTAVDVAYTIPIQFKLDGGSNKKSADLQNPSKKPYAEVEQMPEFQGGQEAFMKFIIENVKYPRKASENNIQGKVLVNFIILSSGKIDNAKVIQSVSPELDVEALRVVSLMPDWKPGMQGGKVVDVEYTMPIQFKLQ